MVHEPLLIGQLHLIFASPYDIIIALFSEHCRLFSLHTSVHVNIYTYENLHITAHRFYSPNFNYDTAIAKSLHSMLHMQ